MSTASKTKCKVIHKAMICLIILALGISLLVACNGNNTNNEDTEYELTVTASGTENATAAGGGKYKAGETVVVTANVPLGYTFTGWYDGGDKISDSVEYIFTMPAKNLTLTAKFAGDTGNISLSAALSETTFVGALNNAQITQITLFPNSIPHYATVDRDGDKAYCYSYYSGAQQLDQEYYLERISGESYYYYRYYLRNGIWHKDLATERYHLSYNFTFDVFSILEQLNAEDFIQNGEYYELKPSAYETFGQIPECEASNYDNVSLRLQNGKITEFVFDCNFSSMESVTRYTYVISYHNTVTVALPQDYVDDAAQFEDYKSLALALRKIYSYETTNFTLDNEQILDSTALKSKLWAVDINNFGYIAYSDEDEVITGVVYAKESDTYYIYTFNENEKIWTKTESNTANTLQTVFGIGWNQMTYSTLLSMFTTQRGQVTITEDSFMYYYEGKISISSPMDIKQTMLIYDIGSTELYIPITAE